MHSFLCRAAVVAAVAVGLAAAAPAAGEEIFPLAEVAPGQMGFGLSVFSGAAPERFEVEVLGVWRNVRPNTSYILGRLTGRGLEESGVVAGMSGSPVYIDGRLAGAVAFAWPFSREAVAGITPIETMRRLLEEGVLAAAPARGGTPLTPADLVGGRLDAAALAGHLRSALAAPFAEATTGVQWMAAGFGEGSRGLLGEALGSVAPAGAGEGVPDPSLEPGSAVAGVLVDGDLRLAATGTVTDRSGDRLLAFGHRLLGLGPMRLPMASAEVVTVLSSQMSSFKISNVGRVVGAFDYDQLAGIRGQLGLEASTVPMAVVVRGGRERTIRLRIADLPVVTPSLVAISLLGAIDSDVEAAGSRGVDIDARFDLGPRGVLEVRQSFDGEGAPLLAAVYLFAVTGYLLQNPLEQVTVEAIDVDVDRFAEPRTARLVGAHVARTLVRPGERVALNVDLVAYRGEPFRRSLELEVPTGLRDGRYFLLVGDGTSMDVARIAIQKAEPVNFRQALAFLRSLHSRRQLVVLGVFPEPGLSVAGEVLPQLPGSVRSLWAAAASGSAVPLELALAQEDGIELDTPVEGVVRIDLEVERREPLGGEGEDGEESPEGPVEEAAGGEKTGPPAAADG